MLTVSKLNGQAVNQVTRYAYDAGGRLELSTGDLDPATTTGDLSHDYVYDGLGRLDQLYVRRGATVNGSVVSGGTLLFSQDFVLRSDGQQDFVTETREDASTVTIDWEYDAQGRLTLEQRSGANAYTHAFAFDLVGNRITKTANGVVTQSTYNDRNQLVGDDANDNGSLTDAVDTRQTYDANGSVLTSTTGGVTSRNGWGLRNRLIWIDKTDNGSLSDAGDAKYGYDVSGVRVRKDVAGTGAGSGTTHFPIDPINPTGHAKPIEEKGSRLAAPTLSYVYGRDVITQLSGTDVMRRDTARLQPAHSDTVSVWDVSVVAAPHRSLAWRVAVSSGIGVTYVVIGVTGFEPAASSSRTKRSSQAELHPAHVPRVERR
jgi:YD repeat-containing protein